MSSQPDFIDYVEQARGYDTPCWIPNRVANGVGYTEIPDGRGGRQLAHRAYYQRFTGPIPMGHEIDHLCEQRACCNPDHLEAVPGSVNRLRSQTPPALNALKTHCKHGHSFDEENTAVLPNGRRRCRQCHREDERKRARLRRAA